MKEEKCRASVGFLSCDREVGHDGSHRGYNEQIDEPMFWAAGLPPSGERPANQAIFDLVTGDGHQLENLDMTDEELLDAAGVPNASDGVPIDTYQMTMGRETFLDLIRLARVESSRRCDVGPPSGERRDRPCVESWECNPFVASCGAQFCTHEEKTIHEQVHHGSLGHPAPVLPLDGGAGRTELEHAARLLAKSLSGGMLAAIQAEWGNTNAAVLEHWRDEVLRLLPPLVSGEDPTAGVEGRTSGEGTK